MKRDAEPLVTPSKRHKPNSTSSIFDDPGLSWDANDLYERGVNDETGFLSCKCFMTWKPTEKKYQVLLEAQKDTQPSHRFEVAYGGRCIKFFDRIQCQAHDTMLLSLKGVKIQKLKNCKNICTLPMRLSFEEGAVIKFTRHFGQHKEELVDTWELQNTYDQKTEDQEDWFSRTPQIPRTRPTTLQPPIQSSTRTNGNASTFTSAQVDPNPHSYRNRDSLSLEGGTLQERTSIPLTLSSRVNSKAEESATTDSDAPWKRPHSKESSPMLTHPETRTIGMKRPIDAVDSDQERPNHNPKTHRQELDSSTNTAPLPALTKKQRRKQNRKLREQERRAASNQIGVPQHSASDIVESTPPAEALVTKASAVALCEKPLSEGPAVPISENTSKLGTENKPAGVVAEGRPTTPEDSPNHDQAEVEVPKLEAAGTIPDMQAGLLSDGSRYIAIDKLVSGAISHFIGVVVLATNPSVTRNGDWTTSVKLVDPSNTDAESDGAVGFRINFFAPYSQWLPQPKVGDALIARNIKITVHYGSIMGVGYKDRASWAVYLPETREISHGDRGDAPEAQGLADGEGFRFSPFYEPSSYTESYCARLHKWWTELQNTRGLFSVADVVPSTPVEVGQVQRVHRLIDDIGPEKQPNGYFNCTVEILNIHQGDDGIHSLYVTDYTKNGDLPPINASWCPQSLHHYVLKIEAWDAAAGLAKTMQVGEYYQIRNARARTSRGGYLEGKLQETKCTQFDPADANRSSHFKALLERKAAHNETHKDEKPNVFKDCTIAEAVEGQYFNCVVEVIYTAFNINGLSYVIVTDYTQRADTQQEPPAQWACRPELKGRILRIDLWDQQIHMAKVVQKGRFYSIQKVRLKKETASGLMIGKLGGMERLINLLNNEEKLAPVLKRRDAVFGTASGEQDRKPVVKKESPEHETALVSHKRSASPSGGPSSNGARLKKSCLAKSIAEIHGDPTRPNVFDIRGRVIDYNPSDLRNAVTLHCNNCGQDIPGKAKACIPCGDFDYEYVEYVYGVAILVEDEEGSRLQVAIHDQCPLLDGLEKKDIRDDEVAYIALLTRLEPLLGPSSRRRNADNKLLDSPFLDMALDSWDVDGQTVYALATCQKP